MEVTQAHFDAAAVELCERRLSFFAREAWQVVEPGTPFRGGQHIEFICRHLEALTYDQVGFEEIDRLLINVPPGTMKSYLVSIFWPAWTWGPRNLPQKRWLMASYGARLSTDLSQLCRNVIRSDWYQRRWGHRFSIRGDEDEKTRFGNNFGGWRQATSVGAMATGKHPDYIVVDDPLSRDDASSDTKRTEVNEWWTQTMSSRGLARNVKRVVVMQRLHEEDLSGYVLENEEGWQHICLPMRFEPGRMQDTFLGMNDWRKDDGQLLWPELFNEKKTKNAEAGMDLYTIAGQMQQRPAPIGGGMLKREWFEIVDAAPVDATRVRYWDRAGTEKAGCYTVGTRMSRDLKGIFYIEDVRRDQLAMDARDSMIVQTAQLDAQQFNNTVFIWHEMEPGSSGKDAATLLTRKLAAYPVAADKPQGDKIERARPLASQAAAGNVKIVKAPWNKAFLEEIEQFPNGKYKDQVDATSGAYNKLALGLVGGLMGDLNCSGGEDDPRINPLTEEEMEGCNPILREIIESTGGAVGGGRKKVSAYGDSNDW